VPVDVASEESVTLTFAREGEGVSPVDRRAPAPYTACDVPTGSADPWTQPASPES